MDERILRNVNTSLNAKFYATNDRWLRECVDYYLNEHNNSTLDEVLEFVISQWQLSDLREISNEKPCLPGNLAQEKCTTLRGHFILQMEKVYDISESKYKQLEKIRNVSNDNIQVTDSEKTQSWEPKKKRMLHLHLTDGRQNVTAIEKEPIRFLHSNLLPGYKLMIKGPVTCRRGIIILDETNVTEIGGEVESLLVPNALENVLARALNLKENPDPYSDVSERGAPENELFDEDFDIDMEHVALIEVQSQEKTVSALPHNRANVANSILVHDEPVSRGMEAARQIRQPSPVSFNQRTESDLLFDAIDDKIFESVTESSLKAAIDSATSRKDSERVVSRDSKYIDDNQDHSELIITKSTTSSWKSGKVPSAIVENTTSTTYQDSKRQSSFETRPSRGPSTDASELSFENMEICEDLTIIKPSKIVVKLPNGPKAKEPIQTGSKRSASALCSPMPNQPAGKIRCAQKTPNISKINRKITDYMRKDDPSDDLTSTAKTSDQICDVLTAIDTNTVVQYKTIKGKVTGMEKLSRDGQCWKLSATITDRTGSINVEFSSEILERFLGFSVPEFSQKKKLKKTNPEIDQQLRQGFRSAENKLIHLKALLQVELAPNKKPKIVKIMERADEEKKTS